VVRPAAAHARVDPMCAFRHWQVRGIKTKRRQGDSLAVGGDQGGHATLAATRAAFALGAPAGRTSDGVGRAVTRSRTTSVRGLCWERACGSPPRHERACERARGEPVHEERRRETLMLSHAPCVASGCARGLATRVSVATLFEGVSIAFFAGQGALRKLSGVHDSRQKNAASADRSLLARCSMPVCAAKARRNRHPSPQKTRWLTSQIQQIDSVFWKLDKKSRSFRREAMRHRSLFRTENQADDAS
jgi:hypothetical protein